MIDAKKLVRQAYYNLLTGQLTYLGKPVPVSDEVKALNDTSGVYILLSNQSGTSSGTFQTFDTDESIALQIVSKGLSRSSRDVVDAVANAILLLVLPSPGINGLTNPAGVQINCVTLSDDRYLPLTLNSSNAVSRRILTFKQHVRQT